MSKSVHLPSVRPVSLVLLESDPAQLIRLKKAFLTPFDEHSNKDSLKDCTNEKDSDGKLNQIKEKKIFLNLI